MPPGDDEDGSSNVRARGTGVDSATSARRQQNNGWFTVPASIRRLFDRFPLITYEPNELPWRAQFDRSRHLLYVFATENGAQAGAPSFNPGSLKWQTFLKFSGIEFDLVASNNHASPTGALPFLLPPTKALPEPGIEQAQPIPSNKLHKWATQHGDSKVEEPSDIRYEAYMSLIELPIRRAWLHFLYLVPANFQGVAKRLYVDTATSSSTVRALSAYELRNAAQAELSKQSSVIDVDALYTDAEVAFSSLSTLLGGSEWFFGAKRPGLLDAAVFSYTQLLLDEDMGWEDDRLVKIVKADNNLCAHRREILSTYYGDGGLSESFQGLSLR